MPTLAGWLTGEQVAREIIEQTVTTMGETLVRSGGYSGRPALAIQPGAGLTALSDMAYAMRQNDEPPVLDWVPARRTMVYRRPLSGAHVLYYIEDWPAKGNLLFASEIKALFAVGVPRTIHLAALDTLLRYGFIPAPWTAFKDIHVVPAGSLLRWQRAKTVLTHNTDYDDKPLPLPNAIEQLHSRFSEVVAGQLPTHDQLAALANGSLPSTIAIAIATQHTQTHFPIATYGYKKCENEQPWQMVEQLAAPEGHPFLAITGVDHPEFWTATLSALEAPTLDTSALALHQLLHTLATETGTRAAISGLGAKALLCTELNDAMARKTRTTAQHDILQWYAETLTPSANTATASLWSQEVAQKLKREETWEASHHARKLARKAAQFRDPRQGWYYLDLHLRLPDQLVNPAQQLAIQEHIAIRSPYLHNDIMQTLSRLPTISHQEKQQQLFLPLLPTPLKEATYTETAAHFPLAAPVQSLLQPNKSELVQHMLSAETIRERGIFDVQAVKMLQQQPEVTRELLLVFTTQLLCHLFAADL